MNRSAALLIGALCKICQRARPFGECRGDESEGYTCAKCFEWHTHALKVLAGEVPRGCQVCHVTFEALRERDPLGNVRMVIVPKDGIYQVLCKRCETNYAPRCGFFDSTLYARMKKLGGYK